MAESQLRKPNVSMAMSKEDIVEYVRCKSDIYYFLENYFMIQNPDADGGVSAFIPFEFQREIIDSVLGGVTNPKTNKPFKRVIARILKSVFPIRTIHFRTMVTIRIRLSACLRAMHFTFPCLRNIWRN